MRTDVASQRRHWYLRLARVVTEVFAPAVWAGIMPLIIGVHAASTVALGVAWGAVAAVFSAIIPYGVIAFGVRRGRLTDHHIGRREQRRTPLLLGLASVLIGLAIMIALDAPGQLVAMVEVMFAVGLACTVVNQYWKLSVHAAVSAASVTILVMSFGPVLLAGIVVVAAIGWSRVVLYDHSTAQVIAGVAAGSAVAAVTFGLLT